MELEINENTRKGKITIIDDTRAELTIEAKEGDIIDVNNLKGLSFTIDKNNNGQHVNTHTVLDMNKEPIKNDSSWMIKEVPYTEPSEEEKKLLEGTKTAKELIEEEQKEEKKELTYEEKLEQYRRDYITKVKVIALYKCKFNPIANPSDFTSLEKQRVIDKMGKIIKNYNDDEVTEEFNTIINNMLLDAKTNYEKLPVMRNK
tara:strand:+ start:3024 stop:3629 length:606 start_codon:yes stop_codon:yes gene_type:complete